MKPDKIAQCEDKFANTLVANGYAFANGGTIDLGGGVKIVQLKTANDGYYHKDKTTKKAVCVHFTAGSINADIPALTSEERRVSVNYYLCRSGAIYELFPEENWAPNIGPNSIGGGTKMSKQSFSIEVGNMGPLTKQSDGFYDAYKNKYAELTEESKYVFKLSTAFRGYEYFASMPEVQQNALAKLISYLCAKYHINASFYANELMSSDNEARSYNGVYTHANVRKDKFDWPPEMMKSIAAKLDPNFDASTVQTKTNSSFVLPPARPSAGSSDEAGATQAMNGHYSGRIKASIEKANAETRGTDGKFYSILNSYGFYDIDDEKNNLTDWQRASVPTYNRKRMTALANCISDMIADFMMNENYGVLCPGVEEIVNKLDQRSSMNKTSIDSTNAALAANPITAPSGAASTSASQMLEGIVSAVMGGNPFDPDMIPPLAIGFAGLPVSFANAFKPGTFNPDWNFLYEHETVKSNKPYEGSDGTCCIGAGIPLSLGGAAKVLVLKILFSVPDVDTNGNPMGDAVNGLTSEEFDTIKTIADKSYKDLTQEEKDFSLPENKLRMAYVKYVQLVVWGAIKNSSNWAYLHWGCITHNSCPSSVKTAICSFIKSNGMAVDPKVSPEVGLISYFINTGMAYLIGKSKPCHLILFKGMKYLDSADNKKVITHSSDVEITSENNGVPLDNKLAMLHFNLAADVICRLTYGSNPNAYELRQRRIDEANLIFKECGCEMIEFGKLPPSDVKRTALEQRHFFDIMNAIKYVEGVNTYDWRVYDNKLPDLPIDPSGIKIIVANDVEGEISEKTEKVIRYIAMKAKVPGVVVTSLYRDPNTQAESMFKNRQNANGGRAVSYAAGGRSVDDEFDKVSKKYNNGEVKKITSAQGQQEAIEAMANRCIALAKAGTPVSKHGADPSQIQAVDMGPNSMLMKFNLTEAQLKRFQTACLDAVSEGYCRAFFGPAAYGPKAKDPAFHIEVYQDERYKEPDILSSGADLSEMNILPSVDCYIKNDNLTNPVVIDEVFVHDQVLKKME